MKDCNSLKMNVRSILDGENDYYHHDQHQFAHVNEYRKQHPISLSQSDNINNDVQNDDEISILSSTSSSSSSCEFSYAYSDDCCDTTVSSISCDSYDSYDIDYDNDDDDCYYFKNENYDKDILEEKILYGLSIDTTLYPMDDDADTKSNSKVDKLRCRQQHLNQKRYESFCSKVMMYFTTSNFS